MFNLKSPTLYKVSASLLAYAIFSAHRTGTPLAKIKKLSSAPSGTQGLTDFTLHKETSSAGEPLCQIHLHTDTTIYLIYLNEKTHQPLGVNPGFLMINHPGAENPCFRSNSVALRHSGKTLCTASVSLLVPQDTTLTQTQQGTLLATLFPTLPKNSPLLATIPPLRVGMRTKTTIQPKDNRPSIQVMLLLSATDTLNQLIFEVGELSFTHPNADGKHSSLTLPLSDCATSPFQAETANLHALYETLLLNPQWQLLTSFSPKSTSTTQVCPVSEPPPDFLSFFSSYEDLILNLSRTPVLDSNSPLPNPSAYCGQYPYISLALYARTLLPSTFAQMPYSQKVATFSQSLTELQTQIFAESLSC